MIKEHKLNAKFIICLIAIIGVIILVVKVIYMSLTGQILDEDGKLLSIIGAVVALSYIYSAITMLRQYISHSGNAFELTENGIENTLVGINLLAFIFIFPVKCIPWKSVKSVCLKDGVYEAKIDTKKVRANFLVKIRLALSGYNFCGKLIKEKLTEDELRFFNIEISNESKDDFDF